MGRLVLFCDSGHSVNAPESPWYFHDSCIHYYRDDLHASLVPRPYKKIGPGYEADLHACITWLDVVQKLSPQMSEDVGVSLHSSKKILCLYSSQRGIEAWGIGLGGKKARECETIKYWGSRKIMWGTEPNNPLLILLLIGKCQMADCYFNPAVAIW